MQDKINKILGKNVHSPTMGVTMNVNAGQVVRELEGVLKRLPGVESAVGQVTVNIKGQTPKTLSFRYK